ncbi:hypothetical protein Cni_G27173 [Canna indica]|uniref:J domain-containing protein n=1 Tax=Canna indica TaxID=4628 RepID=A0AAQ3L092_9LILI|nr:hypothetical protein Cni_G27173 [Canna indica]
MTTSSPSLAAEKHWWASKRKLVGKYLREAGALVATREVPNVSAAVGLLDAALALAPRHEAALELKARSLLFLRRFREVADMLQDYIPSCKTGADGVDDSSTSLGSGASAPLNQDCNERLSPGREGSIGSCFSFRCFSFSDLKRKVMSGILKSSDDEGHWRYLVLGSACCRLGLIEDAMVLLQTGRRLAAAASRRRSVCFSNDRFISYSSGAEGSGAAPSSTQTELESASQLLTHIKLLLRRASAAAAVLDADAPAEAARHFSKVLDGRRGVPAGFAAGCFVARAAAYSAAGRLAEAIADCNRALAVEPSFVEALRARADLLEAVGSLPDCLRDLDLLKLLYDSILRDGKLPGPPWRLHQGVRHRDIPAEHRALSARAQQLRCRLAAAGGRSDVVDYYALMGVRRGCTKSELERAHLLLMLRHKPEKAAAFVDRLEFADDHRDPDSARDQARMSATILYRMLQKGYSRIMATVMMEENAAAAVAQVPPANATAVTGPEVQVVERSLGRQQSLWGSEKAAAALVLQGMFCRDMAVVGSVLSQSAIPVK